MNQKTKLIIFGVSGLLLFLVAVFAVFVTRHEPEIKFENQPNSNTRVESPATRQSGNGEKLEQSVLGEIQSGNVTYPKSLSVAEKDMLLNLTGNRAGSNEKTHIVEYARQTPEDNKCYRRIGPVTSFYFISKEPADIVVVDSKQHSVSRDLRAMWGADYQEHEDVLVPGGSKLHIVIIEIPFGEESYTVKVSPNKVLEQSVGTYTLFATWTTEDTSGNTTNGFPSDIHTIAILAKNKTLRESTTFSLTTPKSCVASEVSNLCGLRAISFTADSAAEEAGLRVDDLITGLNGTPFTQETATLGLDFRTGAPVTFNTERGDIVVTPKYSSSNKRFLGGVYYTTDTQGCDPSKDKEIAPVRAEQRFVGEKITASGFSCSDSDGGKDYFRQGMVNGIAQCFVGGKATDCPGGIVPRTDVCAIGSPQTNGSTAYVYEYFCGEDGRIASELGPCPNGCLDGACKR